ncbi:MAG: aromatic aminobenezylarsenical efflux permease ArsG family transporter [Gemmataceae bacterium]
MTPILAWGAAFWLGVLTSISPCPLATNLAAVSYVGRDATAPRRVILAGLLYTLGRVLVYVILAALLVASTLSAPGVSLWLQGHLNKFLGPLLVLVGMILLGMLSVGLPGAGISDALRDRVDRLGLWGAALLGAVFALSFCPVSAALYFGSLLPLAVRVESTLVVPAVYGLGTALPVIACAALLAMGTGWLGAAFQRLTQAEWWVRKGTGLAILVIGLYLTLHHVWHVV